MCHTDQQHGPPLTCSGSTPPSPTTFVHSDLGKCTHVFLRQDKTPRALEPPSAAPSRSRNGKRRHWDTLCGGGPSPCQLIGSSRPASSKELTAGIETSVRLSTQHQPKHHLPRHHSPPHELHAPVATTIFPHASTYEQPPPPGGDVGTSHSETSATELLLTIASPTPIGSQAVQLQWYKMRTSDTLASVDPLTHCLW
jgi:hypothetical protein